MTTIIQTLPIYQVSKKPKVEFLKFGMGALEECNYGRALIVQPSNLTINIGQVGKMVGLCTSIKTLKSSHKS